MNTLIHPEIDERKIESTIDKAALKKMDN